MYILFFYIGVLDIKVRYFEWICEISILNIKKKKLKKEFVKDFLMKCFNEK